MTLMRPLVDDRTFQDIVDEAKGLIPRYCPQWTDHNVSDPGVALIEVFAWMTEQLLYRLNHVPEDLYVRFLELVGIGLQPGSASRAPITFWLSGPQPGPVTVPAGTQVGTPRTEFAESIVFITEDDLVIRQPELTACVTSTPDGMYADRWNDLQLEDSEVECFSSVRVGDAIYFGFADALAGNVIRLEIDSPTVGVGVQPDNAPLVWEAWGGDEWLAADVHTDDTGGLNREGTVVLFLPGRHETLTLGPERSYWIRCRYAEPDETQDGYRESPRVRRLSVIGLGGTTDAQHAQVAPAEVLGSSDGRPGQTFQVRRTPVLAPRHDETVVVEDRDGATEWQLVDDFASSGEADLHFTWDVATGAIRFGPQIRHSGGNVVQHGAIPESGARVSVTSYRYGGGAAGNVGPGTISVLKSSIPWIARVENRAAARGGVEPESVQNAMLRGPMTLRTGNRAVTIRDFERLALDANPEVARARCLPPSAAGGPVRLLIVPRVAVAPTGLTLDHLAISDHLRQSVAEYIDERRILTSTVETRTPYYQGVTVAATLQVAPGTETEFVRDAALEAMYRYMNPILGGPAGNGWPFGGDLDVGELFALLSSVDGVTSVAEVLLFLANLRTGERGEPRQRIRLRDDALLASYQHQVRVQ